MITLENSTLKVEVKDDNLDLTFKFELSNQELKEFKDICSSFEENSITFQNSNYICNCHFIPFLDGLSVVTTIKSAMGKPLEIVDVDDVDNIQEHKTVKGTLLDLKEEMSRYTSSGYKIVKGSSDCYVSWHYDNPCKLKDLLNQKVKNVEIETYTKEDKYKDFTSIFVVIEIY